MDLLKDPKTKKRLKELELGSGTSEVNISWSHCSCVIREAEEKRGEVEETGLWERLRKNCTINVSAIEIFTSCLFS